MYVKKQEFEDPLPPVLLHVSKTYTPKKHGYRRAKETLSYLAIKLIDKILPVCH
jgi:hypothetical protein